MAKMIPRHNPDFHNSSAEQKVYRALDKLPDNVTVIHSLNWLKTGKQLYKDKIPGHEVMGEGDFVIIDPQKGILVIEVKGGSISLENGEWKQKNRRTGEVFSISPFHQAKKTQFQIRDHLIENGISANSLRIGHAVWFPDGELKDVILPMESNSANTFDARDLVSPQASVQNAFKYWEAAFPNKNCQAFDKKKILSLIAPSLKLVRSFKHQISEQEAAFLRLTNEQARIIEFLDHQQHACIMGGAGTGKTLLAVEKAKRLAGPNTQVLFLCYNSMLQQHLEKHCKQPNVTYLTFDGFAREVSGNEDYETARSTLLDHLADKKQLPYHHLIIDEGQDFQTAWLEFLRYRFDAGSFYLFFDSLQAVQGNESLEWIEKIPCRLVLSRNCRNTDEIAETLFRVGEQRGTLKTGEAGMQPVLHLTQPHTLLNEIGILVDEYVNKRGLLPSQISVLTTKTIKSSSLAMSDKLAGYPLADRPRKDHITFTTVRKFKGLESAVVFLIEIPFSQEPDYWRPLVYVGSSRATSVLHLFPEALEVDLSSSIKAMSDSDKAKVSWKAMARLLKVKTVKGDKANDGIKS